MVQWLCLLSCQPWLYICYESPVYDKWFPPSHMLTRVVISYCYQKQQNQQKKAMRFSSWGSRGHAQRQSQISITRVKFALFSSAHFSLCFHNLSSLINQYWNSQLFISRMAHKEILRSFQRIILKLYCWILLFFGLGFWGFSFLLIILLAYYTIRVVLDFESSESFK